MDFTLSFAITYSVHSQQHHFSAPALPRIHGMAALSPGGQASETPPAQLQAHLPGSTWHPSSNCNFQQDIPLHSSSTVMLIFTELAEI